MQTTISKQTVFFASLVYKEDHKCQIGNGEQSVNLDMFQLTNSKKPCWGLQNRKNLSFLEDLRGEKEEST